MHFLTGETDGEGFFRVRAGIDQAIARALSYAPYADMLWCETSKPNVAEAKKFAESVHDEFPGKLLAYNCSPSFNWKAKLDSATIAKFQRELGAMGYKFQFVTLAGFHALNYTCSNSRAATGSRDGGVFRVAGRGIRGRKRMVTPRRNISAKSAPAISMKSRK